eukprot:GSChrysophyteH1.ASY1.ANO1.501.1 assembled CDS
MDIIINSLYKNKEVFLRELISNASDALDKIRFLSLSDNELLGSNKDLEIQISTTNFVEALADGGDMSLIGQFGVGFYSIYLVADKVRVISKSNEDVQHIWESTADSSFSVAADPRGNTLGRGTEITAYLKEDAVEFMKQDKLEELIQRYSEFITFPIKLYKKTNGDEDEDGTESEEDGIEPADSTPKTEQVTTWDWHTVNSNVAIWARDQSEVSDEEYKKFYKAIAGSESASTNAHDWIHFKAEGEVEFKGILYIPDEAGNIYDDYNSKDAQIRLYVRKVLIQEDFEDLLPKYLNFIKGVVDSDDLPLNVSRETLQQHKILKVMSKKLVRKALEMMPPNDPEHPYIKFWEQFGRSIKMGVIEDMPNRSKLAKLLRYKTSTSDDKWNSLESYIENMQEWQKDIYFLAGDSLENVEKSPFLEVAKKKGVEVLYLTEPVDEYVFQHMSEFEGHKLQSLSKEGINFGDEDEETIKKRTKAYKEHYKPLTKFMKDLFGSKVNKVTISQRVDTSPAVISTGQTLELNPRHPIISALLAKAENAPEDQETKDLAMHVYDVALMTSGFVQEDVEEYAERMYRTVATSLKIPEDEEEEEEAAAADAGSASDVLDMDSEEETGPGDEF